MKLDKKTVAHLAGLAKIELSEAEQESIQNELSAILDVVDVLNSVSTEAVEPTSQVTGLQNVVRADEENYTFEKSDMLATMPDVTEEGQLKVHAVFTGESPSH